MPELESYQNIAEPFLHQLCDLCQATSIWLMKHDFKKRIAIVVGEYISQEANDIEKMSDLGEPFPEGFSSEVWRWLRSENPQPYQFHIEGNVIETLDTLEYIENDVKSVLCLSICHKTEPWGFIEIWETRRKQSISAAIIEAAQAIVQNLEIALRSPKEE
ncbi:MAG: hypothetical protein Q9P44_03775 [Anaerolineae bacterium]|nr:hypothetical protein [Anaerolineae bacterium]